LPACDGGAKSRLSGERFFEATFDLVPSITGPGVAHLTYSGPTITGAEWRALQQQFGRTGVMTFALWAN